MYKKYFCIIFLVVLMFNCILAEVIIEGQSTESINGVSIEIPEKVFNNATGSVNKSEIWITNEGDMNNVADLIPTLDSDYVRQDGTTPLTSDWDAISSISSNGFISDVFSSSSHQSDYLDASSNELWVLNGADLNVNTFYSDVFSSITYPYVIYMDLASGIFDMIGGDVRVNQNLTINQNEKVAGNLSVIGITNTTMLNVTQNLSVHTIKDTTPTSVMSLFPNSIGNGSNTYYATSGMGVEFFKDADYYAGSHNNANNENPMIIFYGATNVGQRYAGFGVDDWQRLTFSGSVLSVLFNVDLATNGYIRNPATERSMYGWNTKPENHSLFLGIQYYASGPDASSFIIARESDATNEFGHPLNTNPTVYIHSATGNTTDWIGLTHDTQNAVVSVGGGNIVFSNSTDYYGTIEYGTAIEHTPTLSKNNYLQDLQSIEEILDENNKVVRLQDEVVGNLKQPDYSMPVYVWDWYEEEDDGRDLGEFNNLPYIRNAKRISGGMIRFEMSEPTYPYSLEVEGADIGMVADINRIMIAELKKENDELKVELCKKDNTYAFC